MSNNILQNKHLLWRAGFGIEANAIKHFDNIKYKDLCKDIFEKAKENKPQFFDVADSSLKEMFEEVKMMKGEKEFGKKELDREQRQKIRKISTENIRLLNQKWIDEMINSKSPLTEKMALFWHGHFACREANIFFQQLLLHEIRTNSLGNFGTLLKAVSKSASMLSFLNNQQNKKKHPNENFAREVMELFTLGRGNYSEKDIKEAARAFTGWGYNYTGEFVFRKNQHDDGEKTILGKTGNFDGDDVLNILLEQKQTAVFITTKIYKYFVNEKIDEKNIAWLSKRFFENNYDITKLMQDIFTSNWFYDEKNIGIKIKSPVELWVGIQKQLPMQLNKTEIALLVQKSLGQILFYPPNVAGWPGGKNWIDTSSLMIRLQIPRLIKDDEEFIINPKSDDDLQMGIKEIMKRRTGNIGGDRFRINAQIFWTNYIEQFENVKKENLLESIKNITLQNIGLKNSVVENNIDSSSREAFIKTVTIALMSTPEYQLC